MSFPSLAASQRCADQAESRCSFGGSGGAEPVETAEVSVGKNGARQHSVWGQATAVHTVGTDRVDNSPHQSKEGKEQSVILGRAVCFEGKVLVLG